MPFASCPACKQRFHLQVSDVEAWYRERWPLLPVGAEVPEECPLCWGKRTGVEFSWAERIRPYRREEFAGLRDRLPERGAVCPGCSTVLPRFADLTPDVEERVRDLVRHGRQVMAAKELVAAMGCPLSWAHLWITHPQGPELHARQTDVVCYYCGKPLRTALARQCVACGMDWHDERRVVKLGGHCLPPASDNGPPETLGSCWVVAWARRAAGKSTPSEGFVIVRDDASGGWCLFRCGDAWDVRADTWHASLAEAQAQGASEDEALPELWRYRAPPRATL